MMNSLSKELDVVKDRELSRQMGRKQTRNPEKWARKFVKRLGLRMNSLISEGTTCCKKQLPKKFQGPPGKAKGWIPKAIL